MHSGLSTLIRRLHLVTESEIEAFHNIARAFGDTGASNEDITASVRRLDDRIAQALATSGMAGRGEEFMPAAGCFPTIEAARAAKATN